MQKKPRYYGKQELDLLQRFQQHYSVYKSSTPTLLSRGLLLIRGGNELWVYLTLKQDEMRRRQAQEPSE